MLNATVCPINHSSRNQRLFYSGKHKFHAIKYEISVHLVTEMLVWINGPIYASMHDMCLMYLGHILDDLIIENLFWQIKDILEIGVSLPFLSSL